MQFSAVERAVCEGIWISASAAVAAAAALQVSMDAGTRLRLRQLRWLVVMVPGCGGTKVAAAAVAGVVASTIALINGPVFRYT